MDGTMSQVSYEKVSGTGTFWRSPAAPGQLKAILRDQISPDMFKSAGVATGGETEFEQAFSSLAYAYLKDKAPRLLDYLVGFQLVERNDDNTRAMGVFGFSVGDQWLYAPVFFLNGDLKGHELLYLKNKDAFVPMKENWVNYLISRKPHVLGEPSPRDTYQLGGVQPDISGFSNGFKRAFDQWAQPFLPVYAATKTASANSLYKSAAAGTKLELDVITDSPYQAAFAEIASSLDLNGVISSDFNMLKVAFEVSQKFPAIADGFTKFYGKDCFSRWGSTVKEATDKEKNSILPGSKIPEAPRYATTKSLIPEVDTRPEHPVKSGALRMYVYEHVTVKGAPELTDNDREKLMTDTVLIKDHRKGEEVSKAYSTQMDMRLINPDETNLYSVLEKPGSFSKMFVAVNPMSNNGGQDMVTAVRLDDGNKAWLNSYTGNVFVDQEAEGEEWNDWFDDLSGSADMKVGGTYLAVLPTHSSTVPFVVREDYGDGLYKVDFETKPHYNETRVVQKTRAENGQYLGSYDPSPSPYGALLRVGTEGTAGTRLRAVAGELRVPNVAKFLTLKEPYTGSSGSLLMPCCDLGEGDHSDPEPIQFGNIEDIQTLFYEKTARMKLYNDGTEVSVSSVDGIKRLSKKGTLLSLVADHGFTEKAARKMLKEAETKQASVYRVTYAPGFGNKKHLVKSAAPHQSSLAGGPNAPFADVEPQRGVEMLGGRTPVMTQHASESVSVVPGMEAANTDPQVWDPWQNYTAEDFQGVMSVAQQAAGEGQKEVFDTAMIGTLLKSVRQDSIVDRHLGDLMKAINSLGRILFLFYWHQEEFEDRYGKSDMPELEDSLRNAFESLGDVTLFLKEKTIESPFGENAELNLDESARN
jgi:hypothetical protein|tara:strand:+ start:1314 stop:3914 length:2601 start_codon:yes stop_codon:yes gene_type:complete